MTSTFLDVDLGSPQTVDRITLHDSYSTIGNYRLKYWTGSSWQVFDSGASIEGYKEHNFSPTMARWFRLEILSPGPGYFGFLGLNEFRFFDTAEQRFSAVYDAFGEELQVADNTGDHFYRFNGKERSQVSRFHYYGYRHYDPLSMVWTQGDPLYRFVPELAVEQPRRTNLYDFSLNNPLRYLDPDGRDPQLYQRALAGDVVAARKPVLAEIARSPGLFQGPNIQVDLSKSYRGHTDKPARIVTALGKPAFGAREGLKWTMLARGGIPSLGRID